MPKCLTEGTFAHSAVLPENVASGALALVGAVRVYTAEGTQQGVQGTLVHIWRNTKETDTPLSLFYSAATTLHA